MMTKHYIASGKNWKWKGTNMSCFHSDVEAMERVFLKILFRPSWQTWKSQPTNSSWHFIFFWNLWWKYESFSSELWHLSFTHPIQRFSFRCPPACVATLPGVVGSSSIEGNKAALGKTRWNWEKVGEIYTPRNLKSLRLKTVVNWKE